MMEILPEGNVGATVTVHLEQPLTSFFTSTVRAGCRPSPILDVLGDVDRSIRYARIRVEPKPGEPKGNGLE